jgi:hypothetical protein
MKPKIAKEKQTVKQMFGKKASQGVSGADSIETFFW